MTGSQLTSNVNHTRSPNPGIPLSLSGAYTAHATVWSAGMVISVGNRSWLCPRCARRVPNTTLSCRCGHQLATPPSKPDNSLDARSVTHDTPVANRAGELGTSAGGNSWMWILGATVL